MRLQFLEVFYIYMIYMITRVLEINTSIPGPSLYIVQVFIKATSNQFIVEVCYQERQPVAKTYKDKNKFNTI